MNTKGKTALIAEAVELAGRIADAGADEFTQWLGAFMQINKPRTEFTCTGG